METNLYLVRHECEDDPYCASWYEIDLMTHDKNMAYSKLREMCETAFRNGFKIRDLSDYVGFIEEYAYNVEASHYDYVQKVEAKDVFNK